MPSRVHQHQQTGHVSQLDPLKNENEQLSRSLNEEAALLEDAKIEISGLNMKVVDLEAWLQNIRKQLGGKGNGNATCVRKVRHWSAEIETHSWEFLETPVTKTSQLQDTRKTILFFECTV